MGTLTRSVRVAAATGAVLAIGIGAYALAAIVRRAERTFTLSISSPCGTCEVSIDGNAEGAVPVTRKLPADATHTVVVRGPCGEQAGQQVSGKPDEVLTVSLAPALSTLKLELSLSTPAPLQVKTSFGTAKLDAAHVEVPACIEWVELSAAGFRTLRLPRDTLQEGQSLKVGLSKHADELRVAQGDVEVARLNGEPFKATVAAFDVDVRLVRASAYEHCVQAGACPSVFAFKAKHFDAAERCVPVDSTEGVRDCIDAFEAHAYCAWAGGRRVLRSSEWLRLHTAYPDLVSEFGELATDPDFDIYKRSGWVVAGKPDALDKVGVFSMYRDTKKPRIETMLSVDRRPQIGFRCAGAVSPPPPPPRYPGPCVMRSEGEPFDGFVDMREVFEYEGRALARATIVHLDPGLKTQDFTEVGLPKLNEYDQSVVHSNALGQPLALQGDGGDLPPEFLSFDPGGNLISVVRDFGDGMRTIEEYDYHCWEAQDHKTPPCPRAPPGSVVAPDVGFGECFAGPSGAWTLEFVDLSVERKTELNSTIEDVRGAYHVVYTPKQGAPARSERIDFSHADIEMHELTPLVAFDYDGDGHQELFVRMLAGAGEEPGEGVDYYTFKDGKVQTYDKLPRLGLLSHATDEDRDGRPDLWASYPFEYGAGDHEMGCRCSGGFSAFFHSLPDGTFSHDDAMVTKMLKKQCRKHPDNRVLFKGKEEQAFERINCMHLWGDSIEAITKRATDDCRRVGCDLEDGQGCCQLGDFLEHLNEVAKLPALLASPP